MSLTTKNRRIIQSNAMTEAAYTLTRDQKRIMYLCMSKLPKMPDDATEINHSGKFSIYVSEYAELFGIPSSAASQDIRLAISRFKGAEVVIYRPEYDLGDEKGYDAYQWITKRGVRPSIGMYEININPDLIPFMAGLKRNFTQFHLSEIHAITNPLVMRLYETLCQYRGARSEGVVILNIDWIRDRYQLPASYKRMADFKKRFLEVAISEINAKTPLKITVSERKKGRTITDLIFNFIDTERQRSKANAVTINAEKTNIENPDTELKQTR